MLAIRARISETTARDLRGVELLATYLDDRLAGEHQTVAGRWGPFEATPSREDLQASRAVLERAARHVVAATRNCTTPVTLASDCALAIATLPAIADAVDGVRVLWLDAHADYDTPATQTTDFLGCMSLAGACGAWDTDHGQLPSSHVVHVGARSNPGDFDYAGQEQGRRELGAMLVAEATSREVLTALGDGPVYVHLDPDVLDPQINPTPYARQGGMRAAQLLDLLRDVRIHAPIVGVEVTAFHSSDDPRTRERVRDLLGDGITTLVG